MDSFVDEERMLSFLKLINFQGRSHVGMERETHSPQLSFSLGTYQDGGGEGGVSAQLEQKNKNLIKTSCFHP